METNKVHMADLSKATADAVNVAVKESVDINHFRPYDSALPVPAIEGYRIVKCLYKAASKSKPAEHSNSYIRVPDHITEQAIVDNIATLVPYFVGWMQEQENVIIKEQHKSGVSTIEPSSLSIGAILAHLEATATGSRLNGEMIAAWFADSMRDNLAIAFAEKIGITDEPTEAQLTKLEAILSTYEGKYKSLASGKTAYRKEEAELLQRALEVTQAKDTLIGTRFYNRLEAMKTATADDLLMSL